MPRILWSCVLSKLVWKFYRWAFESGKKRTCRSVLSPCPFLCLCFLTLLSYPCHHPWAISSTPMEKENGASLTWSEGESREGWAAMKSGSTRLPRYLMSKVATRGSCPQRAGCLSILVLLRDWELSMGSMAPVWIGEHCSWAFCQLISLIIELVRTWSLKDSISLYWMHKSMND